MSRRRKAFLPRTEKVLVRCGSCKNLFYADCGDLRRPPPDCVRCRGSGTFWSNLRGGPIGVFSPEKVGRDAAEKDRASKRCYSLAEKISQHEE
jgi:hypothetical protein